MPTVEKATPRRVAVAALPGERLQGAETGASAGSGSLRAQAGTRIAVAQLGQAVADIGTDLYTKQQAQRRKEAAEAKDRADTVAVVAGQNEMNAWRRQRLHDPENGALAKQGKDSFGEPEAVATDFEKQAGDVMKKMATPEQRVAFERWLAGERDSVNLAVMDHVGREMQSYTANELKANVANSVDLAIKENMTDIRQGAVKIADAEANMRKVLPHLGLPPQEVEQQIRAMRTQAVEGTIDGMLARGRTQDARAYYDGVKDSIEQKRRGDIEKSLKAGTVKKEAQTQTERILSQHGTITEQRAAAKQIEDADVQDEVLQRIEHEHAVNEAQAREGKRDLLRGIADKLDKTRNFNSITPAEMKQLDPDERSAFRSYVKGLIEFGDMKTDRTVWLHEVENADKDPLKWAQEVNLEKKIHQLSKADFNDLVNLRSQILNGNRKAAQTSIDGMLSNLQIVNERMNSVGIDPNPKPGTPEAKMKADVYDEIDREVQRQQTQKGRKLSNDEIRQISDSLLIDTVTQKGTGNPLDIITTRPYYDVTQKKAAALAAIPPADRAAAEESLRRRKIDPTPDEVLKLWLAVQERRTSPSQTAPAGSAPRTTGPR